MMFNILKKDIIMKKAIIFALIFCFSLLPSLLFAKDVYVRGYYRKDGTYVRPHYRSAADGNSYNNWSTKGILIFTQASQELRLHLVHLIGIIRPAEVIQRPPANMTQELRREVKCF